MSYPLRYKPCYRVERADNTQVFLFSEKEMHLLTGHLHYDLCPFLKVGKYPAKKIAEQLKHVAPEMVYYALARLENCGYIEEYHAEIPDEYAAFCHLLGVHPKATLEKLKATKIFIEPTETAESEPLVHILKSLHLSLVDNPEDAHLRVMTTENYLEEKLRQIHHKSFKNKSPWMLLKPRGIELWIGPLFIPQETGCYECLEFHLKRNKMEEVYVQNQINSKDPLVTSLGALETTKNLAFHLAALEIFKWAIQTDTRIKGKILSCNLLSMQTEEHALIAMPHCSCCGHPPGTTLSPLLLNSQLKAESTDGGYRSTTPEQTIRKHAHQISHILGIISSLSIQSINDKCALYACQGGNNFAVANPLLGIMQKGFRSFSGGKGKTEAQAKASCLCEAIERYSGVFQGTEIRKKAPYKDLKSEAIHPENLLLISKAQYQDRESHNQHYDSKQFIPNRFCEATPIDWSPAWSLTEKKYKYVPTAFCYYKYPSSSHEKFFLASSNGAAAGNVLEEAILQGFFELVERDSVAIWWYNRLERPSVDLSSFDDPYFRTFVKEYHSIDREVWILDITTDLGIPTFVALSRQVGHPEEEILFGFGSHLDAKIAILRALTEMNQFIAALLSGKKEDKKKNERQRDSCIQSWFSKSTLENQPYLKGSTKERTKTAKDYPAIATKDILEDILLCQKIVEEKGMEMLVLDQTRPEVDLKVVKVIVPGLRHFLTRFAPGRLYDVPVKLGWLQQPKLESELNPIAMFL